MKPSRHKKRKKRAEIELRKRQLKEGLTPHPTHHVSNAVSAYKSIEEETKGRTQAVVDQARQIKEQLPVMLARLNKISDPRNPKKIKHKLAQLFAYGMLMFVYQYGSRREANRNMTAPMFIQNLHDLFPELDTLPHSDTLYRLLKRINVESIQDAHIELIKKLIKGKKFRRWLINNCYPSADARTLNSSNTRPLSDFQKTPFFLLLS